MPSAHWHIWSRQSTTVIPTRRRPFSRSEMPKVWWRPAYLRTVVHSMFCIGNYPATSLSNQPSPSLWLTGGLVAHSVVHPGAFHRLRGSKSARYPSCRPINGVNAVNGNVWLLILYLNIALSNSHTWRHLASVTKIMTIFKQPQNLLFCVEWGVKLYYTIPYFSIETTNTYHFNERLMW